MNRGDAVGKGREAWSAARRSAAAFARRSRDRAGQAYERSPRVALGVVAGSAACVVLLMVWLVGGFGGGSGSSSAAAHSGAKPTWFPSYTVTASQSQIDVHSSPGGPTVQTLTSPLPEGTPLTLLMTPTDTQPGGSWIQVFLPTKPNGSTGWIQVSQVKIQGDPYQLALSVSQRELKVYKFGRLQDSYRIAVGAPDSPTPAGTYYLTELLKPTNPAVYGDYAYGLSGHSTTLDSFEGYDAEIGLHGTGDPASIGQSISHGCVRLYNTDIDKLARVLPLGTPIQIQA